MLTYWNAQVGRKWHMAYAMKIADVCQNQIARKKLEEKGRVVCVNGNKTFCFVS